METRGVKDARSRIDAASQQVAAAVRKYQGKEGDWHPRLLITLAGELMLNAKELLHRDQEQNPCRSAWAARNLMELYFWVRYVAESAENARRFHEDMLCDFRDMMKKLSKEPLLATHVETGHAALQTAMDAVEIIDADDRYLAVADKAKEYGEEKEYNIVSKFLSKFVHPTSIAIQLRIEPVFLTVIGPSIIGLGVEYLERACPVLANALNEYRPNPSK